MKLRSVLGLVVLAAIAAVVLLVEFSDRLDILKQSEPEQPEVVRGLAGSETMALLGNPEVVRILRDRHGITFEATQAGSVEMMTTMVSSGMDALLPSDPLAAELFRRRGGEVVAEETVFHSPIVLYTWDTVAEALTARGLVAERDGIAYLEPMQDLVAILMEGPSWADLGLPQLYGSVRVDSTDPRRSSAGSLFAGLLADLLAPGEVATEADLATILPRLTAYYQRMGYMEHDEGEIFESFLKTGVGAKPIIVGFENQLIEFALAHRESLDLVRRRIRTLYPVPTVWSSHPVIALSGRGQRLIEALKDPEIQSIAWEQHGFRSALIGVPNDPAVLSVGGIPSSIDAVIPLPDATVMSRILEAL